LAQALAQAIGNFPILASSPRPMMAHTIYAPVSTPVHMEANESAIRFEQETFAGRRRLQHCAGGAACLAGLFLAVAALGAGARWAAPPRASRAIGRGRVVRLASQGGGWADSGFCKERASLAASVSAHAFELPDAWREKCEEEGHPPGFSQWVGKNWCWEWTKHSGCYAHHGDISWYDAQAVAAKRGNAPDPSVYAFNPVRNPGLCDRKDLGLAISTSNGEEEEEARTAKMWFDENVAVSVLNLDSATGRLQNFSTRLQQLGIRFERLSGVDLTLPGVIDIAKSKGLIPQDFDIALAERTFNSSFQMPMDGGILGTVGVAAGHLHAMSQASGLQKPVALILEDDVFLVDDFVLKLRRLLRDEAPCDWEAISLRSRCPYGECVSTHLTRVEPDGNVPESRCRHGVNYGFYGMVYRVDNLAGLQRRLAQTVWNESNPHCLDVDVALASISDEVAYYAVPSVQEPGFLHEGQQGSMRMENNLAKLPAQQAVMQE